MNGGDERYRFLRRLGEGSTCEVWLAEHAALGRRDALKILHPRLAADDHFVRQFRREARATSRVQHPNIVGVHDFGRLADGRLFLALEYIEGQSLAEVIRVEAPLPRERVFQIVDQIAAALEHAHAAGVLHRDLKPENLLLATVRGQVGVVKVLDFGLAKLLQRDGIDTSASIEGWIAGTPEYMAPEQFRGTSVDPRTDVYALGCVMYALLTGAPPFSGPPLAVMDSHLALAPEPPGARRPELGLPAELDALVMRCLAKASDARFESASELRRALAALAGADTGRAQGPTTQRGLEPVPDDPPTSVAAQVDARGLDSRGPGDAAEGDDAREREVSEQRTRALLLRVADALLDVDAADVDMIVAVAEAREADEQLAQLSARAASLEVRARSLDHGARVREAALAGVRAELSFHGEDTGAAISRVLEIETRIAGIRREVSRQLEAITDEGIELAAARAEHEERTARLYHNLEAQVERAGAKRSDGTVRRAYLAWQDACARSHTSRRTPMR
jgi:tRNA A-37 threonylcarbamoyl transferase component Bud32